MKSFTLTLAPLLTLAVAGAAHAQDVEFFWGDSWNDAFHRLTDRDGDGLYHDAGDVTFLVNPASPSSGWAQALHTTIEDGWEVSYWTQQANDRIVRGLDRNGDGLLAGPNEITVFRDSGALDGNSWPQDLDIADDGAVWWIAGLVIANPQNGLSRLEDLNGDGDANDPGEQVVMVDGTSTHPVEHDLGTTLISPWKLGYVASAGDGVVAYAGNSEQAAYRFEDFNDDGDVLDAGESILLLNATGEHPGMPQNPDFADGTLPELVDADSGYYTRLIHMASEVEDDERVFYFGTSGSLGSINAAGQGLTFLIFRGVDGNGDGDVNDAGEVELYLDASSTSSMDLLVMMTFDVLDGVVYAVGVKPYPALFPGPDGNTWIHRFEDLDGDGDAMDAGEQQLEIFDLQAHGPSPLFPVPVNFGNMMSTPQKLSVAERLNGYTPLGAGLAGAGGLVPTLSGVGGLLKMQTQTLSLADALPGATAFFVLGLTNLSAPFKQGVLVPNPDVIVPLTVDAGGGISFSFPWSDTAPSGTTLYYQYWIADPAGPAGFSASNGLQSTSP